MMGSKYGGIPKFYQEKSSPIVQDSAFPPFKIEHRYKGVYERAGFDINKGRTEGSSLNGFSSQSTPTLIAPSKVQPRYNSLNSNLKNLSLKLKSAMDKNASDRNVVYNRNSTKSQDSLKYHASKSQDSLRNYNDSEVPTRSKDRITDAYNPRTNNASANSFHSAHSRGISANSTNETVGVPYNPRTNNASVTSFHSNNSKQSGQIGVTNPTNDKYHGTVGVPYNPRTNSVTSFHSTNTKNRKNSNPSLHSNNSKHRANSNPSVNSFHSNNSNRRGLIGGSRNTDDLYSKNIDVPGADHENNSSRNIDAPEGSESADYGYPPRNIEVPGAFESAAYDDDNVSYNEPKSGSFADNTNRDYGEQPYDSVKDNGPDNYDTRDVNSPVNYQSNTTRIHYPQSHVLNNQQNYQANDIDQDYHQQNTSHDSSITHTKSNSSNSFAFTREIDDRVQSHQSSTLSANGLTAPTSSENLFSDNDIVRSDLESTSPISLTHGKQINHQHSNSKFSFYDRQGDIDATKNVDNDTVSQVSQSNSSIPTFVVSQANASQQFDPRSEGSNKAFNSQDLQHVYESPAGVPYPHALRFSYGHGSSSKPQDDFKQFQSQNNDYNDFLNDKNIGNNQRNSALSMVSSIISKDSFTNDDDEDDHELQMQLANLKMGGGSAFAIDSPSIQQNKAIPDINIDEVASVNSHQSIPYDGTSPLGRLNYQPHKDHDDLNYVPPVEKNLTIPTFEINEENDNLNDASQSAIPERIHPEYNSLPRIQEPFNQTTHEQNSRQINHEDVSQASNIQPPSIVEPLDFETPSSRSKVEPSVLNDSFNHDSFRHDSFRSSVGNGVPYPVDDLDDSEKFGSFNTEELNEISSASYENMEPLFVRQSMIDAKSLNEINNDSINQTPKPLRKSSFDFSPDSIQSYNDSVKPLSPKGHQIEKELAGMNFKIDPVDSSPSEFTNKTFESENEKQIDTPQKDKAGEGPCRSCNYSIIPGSKGSQRPIFSRTGELSGQWHRSCFSCSFEDCDVVFNKNVQCYAFADFPYCNHHYHVVNNTICESCHSGIEGECIENELEQKWHLNCLKCQKCSNNIQQDYFVINNFIFCEKDAINIINGKDSYKDSNGRRKSGISKEDRIEKRKTRILFLN